MLIGLLAALVDPCRAADGMGADRRHPVCWAFGWFMPFLISASPLWSALVPVPVLPSWLRSTPPGAPAWTTQRRSCARPEHVASLPDADCDARGLWAAHPPADRPPATVQIGQGRMGPRPDPGLRAPLYRGLSGFRRSLRDRWWYFTGNLQ